MTSVSSADRYPRVVNLYLERTLRWLLLSLASLGSAPLWVHHALSHRLAGCHPADASCPCPAGPAACVAPARPDCESGCKTSCDGGRLSSSSCEPAAAGDETCSQKSEAIDDEQLPRSYVRSLAPAAHDCVVCFQLSQSQSVALNVASERSSLHVFRGEGWSDPVVLSVVECPPPARGPPRIG